MDSIPGRDIPKLLNGTNSSSLGTQIYRVELGLVNPISD